jgi:RNA polymerase-binding transcription factor DksA
MFTANDDQLRSIRDQLLTRGAQLGDLARAERAQIEGALERLEAGTYGICDDCGAAIDGERLGLLPDAATCRHCAPQG